MSLYFLPYLVIFITLFGISFPLNRSCYGNNNYIYNGWLNEVVAFFLLLFFLGLRGFIHSDVFSYYPFYEKVPSLFSDTIDYSQYFKTHHWEKGYLLYVLLCKSLFPNYLGFQFISTLIDFILFRKIVNDYLPFKARSLAYMFFYVFYGMMVEINLLRNVKAIFIFLISIRYIGVSFIKYCFFIILACSFHKFSIIYLPLYFILNKKWNRKIVCLIWLLGNIVYILQISFFIKTLLFIINLFPSNIYTNAINLYFSSEIYGQAYGIGFGWIERQICFFIAFYYSSKISNNKYTIFLNIFYIYSFVFLFFSDVSIIVERVPYLFAAGYWFLFPYIYIFLSRKEKKLFLLYFFSISVLKVMSGNNYILADYKFYFLDDYYVRKTIFNRNIQNLLRR